MKHRSHTTRTILAARQRPPGARRSGMILAIAIVCITISLMLATALARAAVVHQRQSQQGIYQQQAPWLAESGIQRAVFHLQQSADYTGETWEVPADSLGTLDSIGSTHAGSVTIRVQPNTAESGGGIELQVTARYPADKATAATHVRTIVIPTVQGSEPATGT